VFTEPVTACCVTHNQSYNLGACLLDLVLPPTFHALVLYVFLTLLYWPHRKVTVFFVPVSENASLNLFCPSNVGNPRNTVFASALRFTEWSFQNKVQCSSVNVVIALCEVLVLSLPFFQFCRRKFLSFRV